MGPSWRRSPRLERPHLQELAGFWKGLSEGRAAGGPGAPRRAPRGAAALSREPGLAAARARAPARRLRARVHARPAEAVAAPAPAAQSLGALLGAAGPPRTRVSAKAPPPSPRRAGGARFPGDDGAGGTRRPGLGHAGGPRALGKQPEGHWALAGAREGEEGSWALTGAREGAEDPPGHTHGRAGRAGRPRGARRRAGRCLGTRGVLAQVRWRRPPRPRALSQVRGKRPARMRAGDHRLGLHVRARVGAGVEGESQRGEVGVGPEDGRQWPNAPGGVGLGKHGWEGVAADVGKVAGGGPALGGGVGRGVGRPPCHPRGHPRGGGRPIRGDSAGRGWPPPAGRADGGGEAVGTRQPRWIPRTTSPRAAPMVTAAGETVARHEWWAEAPGRRGHVCGCGGPRFLRGWPGPARCASEARCWWGLRKRERGPSRTRGLGGTCSTSAGASLFLLLRPLCALWPSFGTPSPTGSQASAAARGRPRLVGGGGPLGQCAARARSLLAQPLPQDRAGPRGAGAGGLCERARHHDGAGDDGCA